jgi:hypothetical protein
MTLPPAAPRRQLELSRQIDVPVYARGDGLWQVDAPLSDANTRELIGTRGHADGASRPFQLDRCHALNSDGEVVRLFDPRWHRPAAAVPLSD